jgi:hypothetical protein
MAEEHRHQYRLCLLKLAENDLSPRDFQLFSYYIQLYRNHPDFQRFDFKDQPSKELLESIHNYLDAVIQDAYVNYAKPLPNEAKKYIDELEGVYCYGIRRLQTLNAMNSVLEG